MELTTTLRKIEAHGPCQDGWNILCRYLGENFDHDEEINLLTILESNGVQDCIWAFRATHQDSKPTAVKIAIECARRVLHIFEDEYPNDKRPRKAIESTESWVNDPNEDNRIAAAVAAYDAYSAAYAADADYDAVYSAYAADSAYSAYAAYAAYADDADYAVYAADYASDAADAREFELIAQAEIIRKYLS